MSVRTPPAAVVAVAALLFAAPVASAAAPDIVVDDDNVECPNAQFSTIQAAVAEASDTRDTIYVCPGTYEEGEAGDNALDNALDITKPVSLVGAGADMVTISPHSSVASIADGDGLATLGRDGGHVIAIKDGARVHISGVTVDSRATHVDGGVAFLDGDGSLTDSRVVRTGHGARSQPHALGADTGAGVVATTAAPDPAGAREVTVDRVLLEEYGSAGLVATVGQRPLNVRIQDSRFVGVGRQNEHPQTGVWAGRSLADPALELTVDRSSIAMNHGFGVSVTDVASTSHVRGSAIQGNGVGVANSLGTSVFDAEHNWWGDPEGSAEGDPVSGLVDAEPWLGAPPAIASAPGSPDFAPPEATVTAPSAGALLQPGTARTITASASSGFPLKQVQFRRGTESLGVDQDGSDGYSATYTPALGQAGTSQTITAVVTDGLGRTATHSVAVGIADAPPTVTIDSPSDGATIPRSGATTIRASADDDVGVRSVTFSKGTTVLGTDSDGADGYSASYTPSAAEAGSGQALIATATDTNGQHTTAAVGVRVEAPPAPQPTAPQQPAPPEDRPPAVAFTAPAPGSSIDPRFAPRLTADASDDNGVVRVVFLDDGKVVCSDDAAPYDCAYAPAGADVGRNTLIALAFDGAGQTAVDFRAVRVGKFTPKLKAKTTPRRDRKRPYRYKTTGSVVLPPGVTPEEACGNGGSVRVQFAAGKLRLPVSVPLRADCSFRSSIAFPSRRPLGRRGRLAVTTRFGGNEILGAARAKGQRVRAG